MPTMESFGNNAGNLSSLSAKIAVGIGGIAAAFKLHESIDSDEQAIILNRGKVKLDRRKVSADFGPPDAGRLRKIFPNTRRARRIMAARREALGASNWDAAEYAKIYSDRGVFTFFSMRTVRKIKNTNMVSGLQKQRIMVDGELREIDASVTWAIEARGQNAARALLRARSIEEIDQKVRVTTGSKALETTTDLVENQNTGNLNSQYIFERVQDRCGVALNSTYGVVLYDYELSTTGPSEAERGRRIMFETPDGKQIHPDDVPQPAALAAAVRTVQPNGDSNHE